MVLFLYFDCIWISTGSTGTRKKKRIQLRIAMMTVPDHTQLTKISLRCCSNWLRTLRRRMLGTRNRPVLSLGQNSGSKKLEYSQLRQQCPIQEPLTTRFLLAMKSWFFCTKLYQFRGEPSKVLHSKIKAMPGDFRGSPYEDRFRKE